MYCDLWSQYINVRKLFKGGNYSRAETIWGNMVFVSHFFAWWKSPVSLFFHQIQCRLFLLIKGGINFCRYILSKIVCFYSFLFVLTFDSSFLDRNKCHFIVMSIMWTNTSVGNFCCDIIFSYVTCIHFKTKMCYYMPLLCLIGFTVLGPSRQLSGSCQLVVRQSSGSR